MFIPVAIAAGLALVAALAGWALAGLVDRFGSRVLRRGVFALLLVLSLLPLTLHYQAEVRGALWGLQEIAAHEARCGEDVFRASAHAALVYTWGVLVGGMVLVAAGTVVAGQWPLLGALTPGVTLALYVIATRWYQDAFLRRDGALIGGGDVTVHFLAGNADLMALLLTGVVQVGLLAYAGRMQFGDAFPPVSWLQSEW